MTTRLIIWREDSEKCYAKIIHEEIFAVHGTHDGFAIIFVAAVITTLDPEKDIRALRQMAVSEMRWPKPKEVKIEWRETGEIWKF